MSGLPIYVFSSQKRLKAHAQGMHAFILAPRRLFAQCAIKAQINPYASFMLKM
ncbi:hypothetical protein [Paraburkholderia bannensis]|uniref:hypothetical protein n=1 Tax=Paraburkholderia bannensis TaxID=765414 RepID=UPI002AB0A106|nr:hypothetical protein [Paraburkholderia bannensis]